MQLVVDDDLKGLAFVSFFLCLCVFLFGGGGWWVLIRPVGTVRKFFDFGAGRGGPWAGRAAAGRRARLDWL